MSGNGDWTENRKLVLQTLDRFGDEISQVRDSLEAFRVRIEEQHAENLLHHSEMMQGVGTRLTEVEKEAIRHGAVLSRVKALAGVAFVLALTAAAAQAPTLSGAVASIIKAIL